MHTYALAARVLRSDTVLNELPEFSEPPTAKYARNPRNVSDLEMNEENKISIYPNPAKASVTISIPNNEEEMLVEFIDVSGRIVKAINLNPIKLQILDVSDLSAGWYAVGVTRPISGRDVKPIFIEN